MRAPIVLAGVALACALGAALSACDRLKTGTGGDEMRWARGALDRNSALTVVAEDDQAKVFTVRMAGSGELRALTLAQIVAGPQDPQATGGTDATPAENAPAALLAQTQPQASSPAAIEASPTPAPPLLEPVPASADSTVHAPSAPAGSRVLASGPGYSIASSGASGRTARASTAPPAAEQSSAPGQRTLAQKRSDPIICQGDRRLRIDGQNLEFSGDAVTAERGCDLHITNSRIVANGVAASAHAANVHIENSTIEGSDSIDASDGSQVYVQASTFKGLSRRLDSAQLHDLGGNLWN